MSISIKEGNYTGMGVVQFPNETVFTFECEKEDKCSVVLIDKSSGKKSVFEVPSNYCMGSLRSVALVGAEISNYWYYYEINGQKTIDQYATAISGREIWNNKDRINSDYEILCGYADQTFDWQDDIAPEISRQDMMMYKLHVRGFSMDNKSAKRTAGTFAGVKNKISYIKDLGFTSVELMPVYEFEEMDIPPAFQIPEYLKWQVEDEDKILPLERRMAGDKVNYWGYGSGEYFAVKASYAVNPHKASEEFKQLVKQLHREGIECIMEVFFPQDVNHNLIIDVLRHWVREYHIDGFHLLGDNLPITAIVQDVMLSRTKILYTGFDGAAIPTKKNYKTLFVCKDEYMYPARKLLNHMNGQMREFLNQQRKQGEEFGYINYITSNNGFTLADIFMYNDRHNEANGEDNLDGNQWNFSNNYGFEGPTRKKYIREIRLLKWKNAMLMLFLSQGVPVIWSGDEFGNSQEGNNNAYCQDNPVGWVNWKNDKLAKEKLDFVRQLIAFRKSHSIISNGVPFKFNDYKSFGAPDLSYHGENAWISDYDLDKLTVGLMYNGSYSADGEKADYVYVGYNFFSGRSMLALPELPKDKKWYLVVDSSNHKEPYKKKLLLLENQSLLQMEPQAISIVIGR